MSRKTGSSNNGNKMAPPDGQKTHYDSLATPTTSTTQQEERNENIENNRRGGPLGGLFRAVVETPKNVFHGLTSPFSKQRGRQSVNDESTPLSVGFASQIEQVTVIDTEAPPSRVVRNTAKAKWRGLAKKVDQGEFLLHRPESLSSKSTDEKRKEAEQEIRSGLEFSLTQCIVAILLYIMIAVIAFSFIFDHWSIVDSCYFAVVTFTTIG